MINSEANSLLVVGGGAAGIVAAWRAASRGMSVTLIEKNPKLGIKLLISGGGRCNITHAGETEELLRCFRTNEARFLRSSFFRFSNTQLLGHLAELGVETYARENGRVFPVSGRAKDVVNVLSRMAERAGVRMLLGTPVLALLAGESRVLGVETSEGPIPSPRVIVATGGCSYPRTGTTGEGFGWVRSLGHTVVPPRPALAPIYLDPVPPANWQGIALRECEVIVEARGSFLAKARGDLLLTHLGISGPAVLEVSREAFTLWKAEHDSSVFVDLMPGETWDKVAEEIRLEILSNGNRTAETLAGVYLPQRLAGHLVGSAGIDPSKKCHQLKKEERRELALRLKRFPLGRIRDIPLERGEVTAGGVELREVDPKTMRSRIVKGLSLCGEILDVAGPIGGYNLQAAFSTGFVAGDAAADESQHGG